MSNRKRPSECLSCRQAGRRPKRGEGVRIVYDPGIQMPGTPTIGGHRIAAEQMAAYLYEYGIEEANDWDLTHEELITACWWAAKWGPRRYKLAWKEWGEMANLHLWYGCINVPLPPTRAEIKRDAVKKEVPTP